MDKVQFFDFLKTANEIGASAQEVAALIKEAVGEDIDPAQLEQLMSQVPQGGPGAGGPPPQDPMSPPPGHPAHQGHPSHEGHSGGHHGGDEQLPLSDEQIQEIAMLIAQHLQEQEAQAGGAPGAGGPGAGGPPLPPEHQQQLDMAKTSEYIGGFISRGNEYGLTPDQSVDAYCNLLSNAEANFKAAAEHTVNVQKIATNVDEETLSYFQGLAEKAASENLTYEQTLDLLRKHGADQLLKEKFTTNN